METQTTSTVETIGSSATKGIVAKEQKREATIAELITGVEQVSAEARRLELAHPALARAVQDFEKDHTSKIKGNFDLNDLDDAQRKEHANLSAKVTDAAAEHAVAVTRRDDLNAKLTDLQMQKHAEAKLAHVLDARAQVQCCTDACGRLAQLIEEQGKAAAATSEDEAQLGQLREQMKGIRADVATGEKPESAVTEQEKRIAELDVKTRRAREAAAGSGEAVLGLQGKLKGARGGAWQGARS